jgi:DNA-directed RNA polymerase subunit RPC12/RpoP
MDTDESGMTTYRCLCLSCGQKLEFPIQMTGLQIACPTCGQQTILKVAYQTPEQNSDGSIWQPIIRAAVAESGNKVASQSSGCGGCLLVIAGFFGLALIIGSCNPSTDSGYSTRSAHEEGVKHWEQTLSREDRELNGMKTETDEEIHRDAEMLQHEQDEGISPAGMLQREIDGRNDPPPK